MVWRPSAASHDDTGRGIVLAAATGTGSFRGPQPSGSRCCRGIVADSWSRAPSPSWRGYGSPHRPTPVHEGAAWPIPAAECPTCPSRPLRAKPPSQVVRLSSRSQRDARRQQFFRPGHADGVAMGYTMALLPVLTAADPEWPGERQPPRRPLASLGAPARGAPASRSRVIPRSPDNRSGWRQAAAQPLDRPGQAADTKHAP